MPDPAKTLAERYVLETRIASGGMASVWRARDDVLARTVAVKILHPSLAKDASFIERFRVEALAAARLSHPNIVAIYDTGNDGDDHSHFIVMEYCGRGTLRDLIASEGPLGEDRVRAIGGTICEALDYAHRHEVVHRDIKPANVLISEHDALKVTDFGIAKAAFASGDITTTGSMIGTVTYISPEQANGDEPDARSDLYSLGVTLYEALVGRPPFEADSEVATALQHLHNPPPAPRSIRAGIPRDLEAVILKALSKDPADRFETAQEMRAALGGNLKDTGSTRVLNTQGAAPPRTTPQPEPSSTGPREFVSTEGKRLLSVVALVIAAVVAAVLIGTTLDDEPDLPAREGANGEGGRGGTAVEIVEVEDFDPQGGDGEHPEDVPAAHDGDTATAWTTSSYSAALNLIKDGVGLRFDLGEVTDVAEVEVVFDEPGYAIEVLASDEAGSSAEDYEIVAQTDSSKAEEVFSVDSSGRYWIVWITGFPGGGGGRGAISEVRFVGN